MTVEETLARVELFSELENNDLERLAKATVVRDFKAGEVILREGELGLGFYVIAKGKVEVVKGLGSGSEQVVATMTEGNFFGEMALFDNEVRSASVRAVDDTECYLLPEWVFKAELATSPSITHALFKILARRIRKMDEAAASH